MSKSPVAMHTVYAKGCELRVTARSVDIDLFSPEIYTDLIVRTVKLWVYLATQIEQGVKTLPEQIAHKSVEQSIIDMITLDETMQGATFQETGENRVTVFDWNHRFELTIHSDTIPQQALDLWWAMHDAKDELEKLYPSQSNEKAVNSNAAPPAGTSAPAAPAAPIAGVIKATRAPNKNRPEYADGQLVEFTVEKIVASSNQGSATFQFWTALGKQYATHTVFKQSKSGTINSDYEIIAPVIEKIGFSFDKLEQVGSWRLITKVAHVDKDGKKLEYHNPVSLTPF